jgi:uncharacterized membrane protein HdeD (DUF308 family)
MNLFLLGTVAMGFLVAGLFFLRFWRETRDRLFLAFAISFFTEAINRAALALSSKPNEGAPFFYLVRLLAYLLILVAIADKNRSLRTTGDTGLRSGERTVERVDGEAAQT